MPALGALQLGTTAVAHNQLISIADINSGLLSYTPPPNQIGTALSSLDFIVRDDGSTANSGLIDDQTANTLTFNVTPVSEEPDGADKTISVTEDTFYTLTDTDFGFSDPVDNDNFTGITITQIPLQGSLQLSNVTVTTLPVTISIADINNGNLVYVPAANQNGLPNDHFDFQVNDSGTTTNGGVNQDQTANRITFDISNISDTPDGTDKTISIVEDTAPDTVVQNESTTTTDNEEENNSTSADSEADSNQYAEDTEFSASSISATLPIDEELGFQNTETHRQIENFSTATIIERELLRSLDVRKHNENDILYLEDSTTKFSVKSIDIQLTSDISVSQVIDNKDFQRGLSEAQLDLQSAQNESNRRIEIGNDVAVSISISTTAGILAWMLRGGALFGSLMAATPLWSAIDPLRITGANSRQDKNTETSEVEKMFDE